MVQGVHTEATFEAHLVEHGGYDTQSPEVYDQDRTLLPDTVLAFIQSSQPKVWAKLQASHKDTLDTLLLGAVLDQRGSLEVLRPGFKLYGQTVMLAYFKLGNTLNPALWDL